MASACRGISQQRAQRGMFMSQAVVGEFLVVHGLITMMIGVVAVTKPDAPAMTLPSLFS